MEFIVKTPAVMGETVNLYEVARSMALAYASAGGFGLDLPAYQGHLEHRCTWLTDEARLGRLPVCGGDKMPRTWNELMLDGEPLDSRVACTKAWTNLAPLNEWGALHGYTYRVSSDGVTWIDERGVLGGTLPAGRFHVEAGRVSEVTGKVVDVETVLNVVFEQPDGGLSPQRGESAAKDGVADVVAESASNAPDCDFSILATRDQLIEAFGRFTGMDASWFKNLKDTPALLTARKVTGQGGRGHIAEPWFCPFEVMQWLADSKRRKGRKLSADKAWELLEKNFPKVYNARSVADPRTGD